MLPAVVFSMGRMASSTSPASSAAATSRNVPYPTGSPAAPRAARCLRAAASLNEWADPWKATRSCPSAGPLRRLACCATDSLISSRKIRRTRLADTPRSVATSSTPASTFRSRSASWIADVPCCFRWPISVMSRMRCAIRPTMPVSTSSRSRRRSPMSGC
jgi:hypothetical protein